MIEIRGDTVDTNEDQHLAKRFSFFAKYSSLVVIAIGLLALAGWGFDLQIFKRVLPGLPYITANTAFTFLLAGIALWVSSRENEKPIDLRLAQICSGAVILIGLLTL